MKPKLRSRTEYSILNIFAGFAGYGINLLLSFISRMIFVRCLTEEYLGVSGLFSNLLSMLSLTELGFGTAIVFALYKPIAKNDQTKIASLMQFYGKAYKIIGMVILALGLAMIPFVKWIVGEDIGIKENIYVIYLLYLAGTVVSYFYSYKASLIIACQRNYVVVTISYAVVIVQIIAQIVVLLTLHDFLIYLIIQISSTFLSGVLTSIKASRDYPFINDKKNIIPLTKEEKHSLFKDVKALTVVKLSGVLVNNTDNIVMTYFGGLATTGVTSNYTLLTSILTSVLSQFFGGMTASVGNLNSIETDEYKLTFFKRFNFLHFWLYGWLALGITFVSSDLVKLFFGENYVLDWTIPLLLAINFYIVGMQAAVWTYKNTLGIFRQGQYILLFTAAINIVGDIVLGSYWGVFGILLSTIIARLFTNVWYDPYTVLKFGLKTSFVRYIGTYFKYVLILVSTGAICYLVCLLINFGPLVNSVLKLICCTLIPNIIFFVIFRKTDEFNYFKVVIKNCVQKLIIKFFSVFKFRKVKS